MCNCIEKLWGWVSGINSDVPKFVGSSFLNQKFNSPKFEFTILPFASV